MSTLQATAHSYSIFGTLNVKMVRGNVWGAPEGILVVSVGKLPVKYLYSEVKYS